MVMVEKKRNITRTWDPNQPFQQQHEWRMPSSPVTVVIALACFSRVAD